MNSWTYDIRPREQGKTLDARDLQNAQHELDRELLQTANESWLAYVAPWTGTYRFISGLRPETRKLIAKLNK